VATNYRLGALGYMALDELRSEDPLGSTGNYAMLDQTMALQWTQNNIRAFGGDPTKVMIFGESAGSMSVCWHLAAPGSAGLFHAAIMESGTCDAPQFFVDYSDAVSFSNIFAQTHNCNFTGAALVDCLRKMPLKEMLNMKDIPIDNIPGYHPQLYPIMPWGIVIDGVVTPAMPLSRLQAGTFNKVPLIIGTNHDEGTIFVPAVIELVPNITFPITDDELLTILTYFFNSSWATQIINQYPASKYQDNSGRMAVILRDYFFLSASRRAAAALYTNGVPVYLYQFTYRSDYFWNTTLGDFHASELLMVFDNYEVLHFSPKDITMSSNFQLYWTNHAKYMTPNDGKVHPLAPNWPKWDPSTQVNLVLDIPTTTNTFLEKAACDFWDNLLYPSRHF
jgi:para-nitrobenzyl esterase